MMRLAIAKVVIAGYHEFRTVGRSSAKSAGDESGQYELQEKASKTRSALLPGDRVARRSAANDFRAELSEIAKLALPIVLTNLGQVAMLATDLAFIGRMGAEATAAAALAGRIYWIKRHLRDGPNLGERIFCGAGVWSE
ncbi:hypothetical protein [Bradyrhizobium sp. 147]|uniref:hypothetical protein n=1 Tax=Bradyrhizobium sp. 147 TaxID=2782623 RepID=UPI001FFAF857|nr:hypothetical protein [Bradyrhizobium sp. 147]